MPKGEASISTQKFKRMDEPNAKELQLHERLLAGEDTALAELIDLHSEGLLEQATGNFGKKLDEQEIMSEMMDLFLSMLERPGQYKRRQSFRRFLWAALRNDLLNLIDKKTRREKKLADAVEHYHERSAMGGEDPEKREHDRKRLERVYAALQEIFPDELDYTVAKMVVAGIRDRWEYAEAIGCWNLPKAEMERGVDRYKDKIKTKLKRYNWENILKNIK